MRTIAVLLCGTLAACSQTGASPANSRTAVDASSAARAAQMREAGVPEEQQAVVARCEAAVRREQQKSIAAARLGSALTMAGGFAGVGGAIAGEAISVGRSLAQAGAESSARAAIEEACMS